MKKTLHGSCHCGAVAYEADADLAAGTNRCNCSYCRKNRSWSVLADPESFRVLRGADMVRGYRFSEDRPNEHCFCGKCGTPVFTRGYVEALGGEFVSLRVASLDDVSAEDLVAAPVTWCDGLNDNWMNPPQEIRHL